MSNGQDAVVRESGFHVVTVGWDHGLIERLANPIAAKGAQRFSHIVHPRYVPDDWPQEQLQEGIHFFRQSLQQEMPEADRQLLGVLERPDVPTFHNMILGDRVISRLPYDDALRYATFLARRLLSLLEEIRPAVVIVGFDAIHGSMALAVAKYLEIPVYALSFSVIPTGLACFCDRMTPAAAVPVRQRSYAELMAQAENSLRRFENRELKTRVYIAPEPPPLLGKIAGLPRRGLAVGRTIRRARMRQHLKYTEDRTRYSLSAALRHFRRSANARRAILTAGALTEVPDAPYALFGLHMQPESSIDVWAPFFSNQKWVIELLSRSIPATHKLLIKIHRSDLTSYTESDLEEIGSLPGVEIVSPFADARAFIDCAELLFAIQGTMGLEAALTGKPVVLLGDSPFAHFPSASTAGALRELPQLVRRMIADKPPERQEIVRAYARYLEPYFPASPNEWDQERSADEIDGYVTMFEALEMFLTYPPPSTSGMVRSAGSDTAQGR